MKYSRSLGWGGNGFAAWVHKPKQGNVRRKDFVAKINLRDNANALNHERTMTAVSFRYRAGPED